jgi:octanoyl-[GcvH]:protein N-octanoyltransferase
MCEYAHTRNISLTLATSPPKPHQRPQLALVEASFDEREALGTGVSAAILRRVARGDLPTTMRIHRTGRSLAFGRIDRLSDGYSRALAIAREHGYEPVERMAGGRAAVFHEGTIAFSRATRETNPRAGTRARFAAMAETIAGALRRLGVDARVGEVPGEYCPGEWSVSWAGRRKLAGIGQRVVAGGAHVGGVLVFAVTDEGGREQLASELTTALREQLSLDFEIRNATLDPETLEMARELRLRHTPRPR